MIQEVKFVENWRVFKTGDVFSFRAGINLLVGDQGSGKSSMFEAFRQWRIAKKKNETTFCEVKVENAMYFATFDFEKENPRVNNFTDGGMSMFVMGANSRSQSHGETVLKIVKDLTLVENKLIILDEPDMALSVRSNRKLAEYLKTAAAQGCQIMAAVHNPILITSVDEVLSLEHKRWMTSQEFMESQA